MVLNAQEYRDVIFITALYFSMYYGFLCGQAGLVHYLFLKAKQQAKAQSTEECATVKPSYVKIKYGSDDRKSLTMNRTVGNTVEQMGPFLVSLWLHAIFVSTRSAYNYGVIYVISRSFYPLLFYMGGSWILLSTLPGYACILTLLAGVVAHAV